MKKYVAALLVLVLLLTGLSVFASAEDKYWSDDLQWENGKPYLLNADGSRVKGWKKVTNYYTDEESGDTWSYDYWIYGKDDGYLAENEWLQLNGTWYLFPWCEMATGSAMYNGKVYLFDSNGSWTGISAATAGWQLINGNWYYVVKEDYGDGDTWLWFITDGVQTMGENLTYAFRDGKMLTEGWQQPWLNWDDDDWVYVNADGSLVKDWKMIDGSWYYFNKEIGYMYEDGLFTFGEGDNRKIYAFDKSGRMVTDSWYSDTWYYTAEDGEKIYVTDWAYLGADGAAKTDWFQVNGAWYYFDKDYASIYNDGFYLIGEGDNETLYAFDKSGKMVADDWYSRTWNFTTDDGEPFSYTAWAYMGADGAAKTGWFQDKGIWYYADKYGWLYTDTWLYADGNYTYHFDESGAMTTGWYKQDSVWYYFKDSGELVSNEWIKDGNTWYYLKEDATMAVNETVTINGVDYKFNTGGAWIE